HRNDSATREERRSGGAGHLRGHDQVSSLRRDYHKVSKGEHVHLFFSAANFRPRSCHYKTLPYGEVEEAFVTAIRGTIDEAPHGKDSAELDKEIANADAEADMLFDEVQELLAITIEEKSAAARKTLSQREADLANAGDRARTLRERR